MGFVAEAATNPAHDALRMWIIGESGDRFLEFKRFFFYIFFYFLVFVGAGCVLM